MCRNIVCISIVSRVRDEYFSDEILSFLCYSSTSNFSLSLSGANKSNTPMWSSTIPTWGSCPHLRQAATTTWCLRTITWTTSWEELTTCHLICKDKCGRHFAPGWCMPKRMEGWWCHHQCYHHRVQCLRCIMVLRILRKMAKGLFNTRAFVGGCTQHIKNTYFAM